MAWESADERGRFSACFSVPAPELEVAVERFLASDDIAFLHVRYPTYGCFACRIDRG